MAEFDETIIQSPIKESNEEILYSTSCRTRDHSRWDVCFSVRPDESRLMKSFKFTNYGDNDMVPMSGFGIGRDFEFNFEGLARSDMNLLVWDAPDESESHAHLKLLTFFPRDVMPAVRYESDADKDIVIVTLPTREEVIFNGKTREVISGVLKEGPIRQSSNGAASLLPGIGAEVTKELTAKAATKTWEQVKGTTEKVAQSTAQKVRNLFR
jgi:hypothetical protein